jgi:hypothetical protein
MTGSEPYSHFSYLAGRLQSLSYSSDSTLVFATAASQHCYFCLGT